MGGLALVTLALMASCCLSQSRELKQSLNDVRGLTQLSFIHLGTAK